MIPEPTKNPLPSGPSNLCFNKEDFMKPDFNVEQFVVECRRRVALETLRDDLHIYLKILQSAMIELINKDYADFVNLSSNLVGLDKAINNLTTPLGQLKEEVLDVQMAMDEAIHAVEEKLKYQSKVREKKACLQRLVNITQSVEKMEQLLGIQGDHPTRKVYFSSDSHEEDPLHVENSDLSGQLIERVATEFNKLQFYVNKSRGLPLVENIKPRIANITSTLQFSLEGSFCDGLEQGDADILRQCLRTYATIDKMRDAENLFRQHLVKPYMEEIISEQLIRENPQGLKGMYTRVLDFIPCHCKRLKEVTSGGPTGSGEVVRGYDFLVNAVWPEVVANIEARTPSIFAPGNPDTFHEKYTISIEFLEMFEQQCGSQASVKRLRSHPSYNTFMSKWSLPVYFQIRFQEIAGSLETSLCTPFSTEADHEFVLHSTVTLWRCLHHCWDREIYLMPLCYRFWKLTLQLLARFSSWIVEVQETELNPSRPTTEDATRLTSSDGNGTTAGTAACSPGAQLRGSASPVQQGRAGSPASSMTPPPAMPHTTMGQIVCIIADAQHLVDEVPRYFDDVVRPHLSQLDIQDLTVFSESITESLTSITDLLPRFGAYIVGEITIHCSIHLKMVNDIPRLFRRTNREVPSKPSQYVVNLLKPLKLFLEENCQTLKQDQQLQWTSTIVTNITDQYYTVTSEVLTSVRKMEESLQRLKKARGASAASGSKGMSDDDKIRLQLHLDVKHWGDQIDLLGVETSSLQSYTKLLELVESARN